MKHLTEEQQDTITYYNDNGDSFSKRSRGINMSTNYQRFLQYVAPGGTILDAGCGSGRDTLNFMNLGYKVVSIDASEKMVKLSTELTGQQTILMDLESLNYSNAFDGIWASASLLHLSDEKLKQTMLLLRKSLKADGVMYCSFKYGASERWDGSRYFNDQNEEKFKDFLGGFTLVEQWKEESFNGIEDLFWLVSILKVKT